METPEDGPGLDSMRLLLDPYKRDVDRTLLRENLARTVEERTLNLMSFRRAAGRPKDLEAIAELEERDRR